VRYNRSFAMFTLWLVLALVSASLGGGLLSAYAQSGDPPLQISSSPSVTLESPVDADPSDLPPGVSEYWWTAAQEEIRQSEYHIARTEETPFPDLPVAYQATNRVHNLRTFFTGAGIRVSPRTKVASVSDWEWGLALTGYGYGGQLQSVAPAVDLVPSEAYIEYHRDASNVVEWYINDGRGLEQGFTLTGPPSGGAQETESELVLALTLYGDLTPVLAHGPSLASGQNDQVIEFYTPFPDSVCVLHYGELRVTDATGRELPAEFSVADAQILIAIDGADAVYPIVVDPLVTDHSWQAVGNPGDLFGYSVGTAGDVNGDGYDDVIVGAWAYESDGGENEEGGAFVFYGSATGLSPSPDWTAESNQALAWFGIAVGTAGDVNGDGYDDIIVGSQRYANSEVDEGAAFVWYGSAAGLGDPGTPANADWMAESDRGGAYCYSVSTAGDVNGDGYDDVIVAWPVYANPETGEGAAFVWYGSATGLGPEDGNPTNADWMAESDQAFSYLGAGEGNPAATTAGDVNGDGYDDIIVGVLGYDNGETDEGAAFVWYGSVSGLGPEDGNPTNADWRAEVDVESASFGFSVGRAGDVNGDNYDDVVVGASDFNDYSDPDNPEEGEGRAFVWYGSATGLGPDGTLDNADWMVEGNQPGARLGFSVATAGDVDNDGYDEVIVGAKWSEIVPLPPPLDQDRGAALVYEGSAAGLSSTPKWWDFGSDECAYYGFSVGTAGDVNGDANDEFLVGECNYGGTCGAAGQGRALLYESWPPTAVDLIRFQAFPVGDGLQVEWETATEIDNAGFNLYRSDVAEGGYVQLNAGLIPSRVPGGAMGAIYTWLDGDVQPGMTYFYRLESVDIQGKTLLHGPVSATAVQAKHIIYLPVVIKGE
jgi:hypothetical protein